MTIKFQYCFGLLCAVLIGHAEFLPSDAMAIEGTRTAVSVGGGCIGLFTGGRQTRLTDQNYRCTVTLSSGRASSPERDALVVISQQTVTSPNTRSGRLARNHRKVVLKKSAQSEAKFMLKGRGRTARYTVRAFTTPDIRLDDPAPTTCEQIINEYALESFKIRACTSDAECGQPLPGTSCGCTRDHVARKGADTSELYRILAVAAANGCSDGLTYTSCDCPRVSGTACIAGMCDWKPAIS